MLMLATNIHCGTLNIHNDMRPYIFNKRVDGLHIIDINKTWEKLLLAARVIAAIENPEDMGYQCPSIRSTCRIEIRIVHEHKLLCRKVDPRNAYQLEHKLLCRKVDPRN